MAQQISCTQTNLDSNNFYNTVTDEKFPVRGLKPHLEKLRKHVADGACAVHATAMLRPGLATIPFWYGPAQVEIPRGTQATAQTEVINGRITRLSISLSNPVVLVNPVGSLVPAGIPGAEMLNSGTIHIDGIDLTAEGHVVPRGFIKMFFQVPIQKYIPLQFCPMINTDATRFFQGEVVKKVPHNSKWKSKEAITSLLHLVTDYNVMTRVKPGRPIKKMNIECIDASVRGALRADPGSDQFVTNPEQACVAITLNKQLHRAALVSPEVRVSPSGTAHLHGTVHLLRAIPYAPTPPREIDVDLALHEGHVQVKAHGKDLLNDLDALRPPTEPDENSQQP